MTPLVLPLPSHLLNQIQQVQQVQQVPRTMFQGLPVQPQVQPQPQPQFQFQFQSRPQPQQSQQHQPFFQAVPMGQPQQFIYHRPIVYEPRQINVMRPPQVLQTPFGRTNEEGQDERMPSNEAFDYRVPIEPMAVNDVPLSMMPITHLPVKSEVRPEEESLPLRRLVPPHPQRARIEVKMCIWSFSIEMNFCYLLNISFTEFRY